MNPDTEQPSTSYHRLKDRTKKDGTNRLTTYTPDKYVRGQEIIPFHIPHKRLLSSLEIKKKDVEPLTGYTAHQKKRKRDHLVPIQLPFSPSDILVSSQFQESQQQEDGPKKCLQDGIFNHKEVLQLLRGDPRIGFYYMVYAVPRNHRLFSPYNLKIVDYSHIDKECFITISAHGVTQHYRNEMIFTPLDKWEKEYDDYCRISKIKLFSKFRLWKAFFTWRKSITQAKYKAAQEYIGKNLFILNFVLQKALLEIRKICLKLCDINFFDTSCLQLNALFQFIENQMHKKEAIQAQLDECRSQFKEILNCACHEALSEEGFSPKDSNMRLSRIQLLPGQRLPPVKDGKIKMSYTDQAKKRRFCARLTCFIHLVDFFVMDSFRTIIRKSQVSFVETLQKFAIFTPSRDLLRDSDISAILEDSRPVDAPQKPMFVTDVVCEPQALLLDPSAEVYHMMFNQIIELWTDALVSIPTFLPDPFFMPFAEPEINGKTEARDCGNGCDLRLCLNIDETVIKSKKDSLNFLKKAFEAAEIYIQRFQFIRSFYNSNLAISPKDLAENQLLEVFRTHLLEFSKQEESLKKTVDSQPLGLLLVKLEGLKKEVLPSSRCLQEIIEEVMPRIGREKVLILLKEVEEKQIYVDRHPESAKEFVDYLEFLESVTERVEEMEVALDFCKELYDLCDEYSILVTEQDSEEYYRFAEELGALHRTIDQKISDKVNLVSKFVTQCQVDINALLDDMMKTKEIIMDSKFVDLNSNPEEIRLALEEVAERVAEYQERASEIKGYQKSFRVEVTRFELLDELINELRIRQLLWESLKQWGQSTMLWMSSDFTSLDPEEIMQLTNKNLKNVQQMEKLLPENLIVPQFKDKVLSMKEKLPTITSLRNPNLKARHWATLEQLMNIRVSPDEPLTLQSLLNKGLMNFTDQLNDIAAQASSEAALEGLLHKVEDAWQEAELVVLNHRDQKDVFVLGGLEEIFTLLEESMININTILSSRNVGPIKSRVEDWLYQLQLFSKTLDEWCQCQQSWLYLESIFSAPDIQRQLPAEAKIFLTVDKSWKDIMRRTAKTPLALSACTYPGLFETFVNNNALLDQVMKCLEAYLESKRVIFPRFYFLSNDELIEILAQTRNPYAVQPHLRKCFDAIAKLEFGKGGATSGILEGEESDKLSSDIVAMISPEGERISLTKGLKARGNVEDWLTKVEESMFTSLRRIMKSALVTYSNSTMDVWVLSQPSQVVLTISQIMWAQTVEMILSNRPTAIKEMQTFEKKNFLDLNLLAGMVRGELTKLNRAVLCALITVNVHLRDNISSLVKSQVTERSNFDWLKQLRYYWEEDVDNCVARMSTSHHIYGYEYLGASPRLVITPLTDRCYLCLMGALQLDLGGAPAGPAGTGKTETTKDLSKSLAIQCVVFNCSEGLDYKMMGRFFSGLAQSGAWCCFDEFNRIDIEVLSVIAQQIITIRNAKAAKLSRFMFEGREIKLVHQCATFITMNPGYAGRTELPDNLKALFRPISMMVPDYGLIAEVILYSEGFESPKILAKKMVHMYKLCSEQLSQQDHYDFGMRAVKSVLIMAGSLKRANPDINENIVLIRALRDSNSPKFLADDALLFQGILEDLFPGVVIPEQDYGHLQDAIMSVMLGSNLQPIQSMVLKVIQLFETCIVRHGVMLVGPSGGGKTTVLKSLGNALGELNKRGIKDPQFFPVHYYIINPKSITMGELYGEVNPLTMEWRDGVLGISVRTAVQTSSEDHQWVICDGPVDALWIENMNTVLDDNKMLCLANSERIKLTPNVTMLFEVQDLAQASPATVSRCGMVYIDPNYLKWLPYVQSWLTRLSSIQDDMKIFILELFNRSIDKIFNYIAKHCSQGIKQVDMGKIQALCALYEALMLEPGAINMITSDKLRLKNFLCQAFVFSALWSLGGNVVESGRDGLDICIRDIFDDHPDARLPAAGDLWSLYINISARRMEPWTKVLPSFYYDPQIPFFDLLVPTQDTVCFTYLMEKMMAVNKPVLYIGSTGVGKSVIAKSVLNNLSSTDLYVPVTLNFSAQTSSRRTQEILEMRLEKRKKNLLGAPLGKKVVIFIDDVNMPKLEVYGAQPPIELLRQYLDFHGLYDREKLFWKEIRDVIITAACAPPGGGRNHLTPRFVRHFSMLLIPKPSETSLKVIFKTILRGFLADFAKPVQDLADSVVSAAIDLYQRVIEDLLPTPQKAHYVFNLRDLSKCIQGVLQADSGSLREGIDLLRLFSHECLRVFHDRLVSVDDKSYFYKLLAEVNTRLFGNPVLEVPEDVILKPPIVIFGDFMNPSSPQEERIYEEIRDMTKLLSVLQDFLDDYNLTSAHEMKLILFMDAIEHVIRIARILRAERGNGLLVGVGGMGKRSLTILGAHLNGYKCFQIELARNYNHESFFEDLRKLYFNAGARNEATVFLFNDTQIVEEEFLEDVNNILNSGEVPGLYEGEEYEKVIQAVRPSAKEAGIMEHNRDAIFSHFISRVRSKLHLMLCMSPIGHTFRSRCRMFPSLVNCCTIDWFSEWPQEALLSVATNSLKNHIEKDHLENYANICVLIHESVGKMSERFYLEMHRRYYTTPSSYLELIKLFLELFDKKQKHASGQRDRIANGLQKLYETNDLVAQMKVELSALGPILKEKSEATNKLMDRLVKEQAQAMEVRQVVEADEAIAKVKADETQAIADDAQADLDQALPAMEAATKALEALNKNDINELKVFNKPPPLVRTVMEAVCLLLGQKTDWATAKVVLADTNFLKKLQDYDKDHIPDMTLRKLKPYIDNKDFVPDVVATQSKVCKSICLWVRAIDTYSKVYRIVEPKKKRLEQAERELAAVMTVLQEKQQKLADVEATIAKLEATYDASLSEKIELEDSIALTSARLARSASLTSALGDEQVRWESIVKMLSEELKNMTGNVLVAAAYLSYLGAFTDIYRKELVKTWLQRCIMLKIPVSSSFNLISVLADPYDIRLWNSFGLPRDKVSTENAILVTQAGRWPLMIDPQEQANRWIRAMEAKQNLRVTRLTDSNFLQNIEGAIRLGFPVLLEELGEALDPALTPLLLRQTYTKSGRVLIRFADSEIDYDKNFRLYMTTKVSNPHYLPEICIQITLVNFTVTPSGLEDQLLADVVRLERPDLETQRTELIVRINADKQQLKNIEDKILQLLFHSTGNILDDEELIETLNESKETSAIISTRLEEAEATEEKISIAREKYRTVAARGSCLYFVVSQLGEIDPMYQYSLKYFKMVFNSVIESSKKSLDLNQRLKVLLSETTSAIYLTVSRGLFERHKLLFSFLLCTSIQQQAGSISGLQWDFLLRGSAGKKVEEVIDKPAGVTITDTMWTSVLYLAKTFPTFSDLPSSLSSLISVAMGNLQVDIKLSSNNQIGKDWNGILDDFSKLIIIKALKQEKLVFAMTEYVRKKLGQTFVESPQIDLNSLFQDTNNITPLIFVLSTGSDPFGSFQRFAFEMGNRDKVQAISLGQGQGPIAEKMIRSGSTRGDWVFLQNCHLAASWMLSLERLVQSLAETPEKVHVDFRLFLSSSPSPSFPVSVLQNSIKVTNEPPKGLKANVKRAFMEITDDFFGDNPLGPNWRKMIFGICFFQAIIQERKKFGPIGWNINYDFSDSDRECAILNLKMFCCEGHIPWDALEYITGEITYGGRVTDNWDQRCLTTILKCFFSEKTLEAGYKFSPSGVYYCPESEDCQTLKQYRNFINNLPIIDEPEIFGMHENANISFELAETQAIIRTILDIQPQESGSSEATSSDDIALEMAGNISSRLAEKIIADEIHPHLKKQDEAGRLPSLTTVLLQEVERFNQLLLVVHSSLLSLNRAIKGFDVMSESLEEVYSAFINNQVPKLWNRAAYPSLKPLSSWVHDLELRIDFIKIWLTFGPPQSFWLSGFFFPQGFLTGVLQTHARKYSLPIDQLLFDFKVESVLIVQDEVESEHRKIKKEDNKIYKGLQQPSDGVFIHGIFLDAARWDYDKKMLENPMPGEVNPPLPVMLLSPCTSVSDGQNRYLAPLYKTEARAGVLSTTGHSTNFIIAVSLPTDIQEDAWIMRGCALLTQLSN